MVHAGHQEVEARQVTERADLGETGGGLPVVQTQSGPGEPVTGEALAETSAQRSRGAAWRVAAVALPLVVALHFGLIVLVIAAPWMVPQQARRAVEAYLVPLFIQDWRLFAPRPDVYDYAVFARGQYRGRDGLEQTPWLDLVEPTLTAVQANRLSPASARLEIVHKAALFTVRAAGPLAELGIGRETVADRWAIVEQQPASLVVLERLASATLAERYVGAAFETVQVMVTARAVGDGESSGGRSAALLFHPVPFQDVRVR